MAAAGGAVGSLWTRIEVGGGRQVAVTRSVAQGWESGDREEEMQELLSLDDSILCIKRLDPPQLGF